MNSSELEVRPQVPFSEYRSSGERLRMLGRILKITRRTASDILKASNRTDLSEESLQAEVFRLSRIWLDTLENIFGYHPIKTGSEPSNEPCLIVSNHCGYLDVPVMIRLMRGAFVSKIEVRYWPIFGRAAASYGTVFVNRKNAEARKRVGESIALHIRQRKQNVVLFPEGTSHITGKEWKRGSFAIAKEHKILVQPCALVYKPFKDVCYYGDDTFLTHLWNLLKFKNIESRVHIFEPRYIHHVERDTADIQKMVQDFVLNHHK